MIVYRFHKDTGIPQELNGLRLISFGDYEYLTPNKNFKIVDSAGNCKFVSTVDFKNYSVMLDNFKNKEILKPDARGVYVELNDGCDWLIRTIKDMEYVYSYDPIEDKIIKIFDVDNQFKRIEFMVSNYEKITEQDVLDVITESITRNYYITKELILYLKLINSKLVSKLLDAILCVDLLKQEGFFREGDS